MRRAATRAHGVGRAAGFSLLELVIVVIIISILLSIAISKLLALQVDAERVAMQNVMGTLRSAVGIKVASLIARGRAQEIADLVGTNPMDRLAELPPNYLGERPGADPARIEGGYWYFDSQDRVLVYRVYHEKYFETSLAGPARARFAIRPVYEDRNGNGTFERDIDRLEGLRLEALEPYRWTN